MTLSPIAKRVYDRVMAQPDDATAALYVTMLVSKGIEIDMVDHHGVVQHQVDKIVSKRLEDVKKGLVRQAVSKRLGGEDIEQISKAADVISKAGFFDSLSDHQRAEWAKKQQRDASGRFRTMSRKIEYKDAQPLRGAHARQVGIEAPAVKLGNQDRARYQQAYQEVQRMLRYAPANGEGAVLSLHPVDGTGAIRTPKDYVIGRGGKIPSTMAESFQGGGVIDTVELHTPIDLSVGGAAFDLVGALGGGDYAGSRVAASVSGKIGNTNRYQSAERLKTFAGEWEQASASNVPSNRIFRRMSEGSRLLQDAAGDNIPNRAKLALQAADYVGQHGEEAAKVLGPHADRAAYRYRGVEKKPAVGLQNSIDMFRRQFKDPDSARNALVYGVDREHARRAGLPIQAEHTDSPIVNYFRQRLPAADLTHLQLKSGVVPPSQGVIIDRKGQVVTEAVGYGDDWYLPFNLKTLSKLKGGEYIRTRTWGGPTTEDIYAGLMSGARAVTVISHNGVYTIEFDDAFRGSRRYNDKAARMVKRYGHILDAVKSRDVQLDKMPESRKKELEVKANQVADKRLNETRYKEALDRLVKEEAADPQMSQDDQRAVVVDYVNSKAAELGPPDANWDWSDAAENYAMGQATKLQADHQRFYTDLGVDVPELDAADVRAQAMQAVSNPGDVANVYGWAQGAQKALDKAQAEYRQKQSPLNLNGEGYDLSMQALREQFPYYIASVRWQPNMRGKVDSGYVKPGYLRPTMAKTGLYGDRDKDGNFSSSTKASAAVLNRYKQDQRPAAPVADESNERMTERTTSQTSASTPTAPASATSAEFQAAREATAVTELYDAVRGATHYHPNHEKLANQPINLNDADRARMAIELPATFGMDKADFLEQLGLRPAETKQAVLRDQQKAEDKKWIKVADEKIRAVRSGGAPRPAIAPNLTSMINNPDADYDFGPEYGTDLSPSNYEYMAKPLLERVGLIDLDDGRLDAAVKGALDAAREALKVDPKYRNDDQNLKLKQSVMDVVQLKQLKRRRDEAVRAETLRNTHSPEPIAQPAAVQGNNFVADGISNLFPPGSKAVMIEIPTADENP